MAASALISVEGGFPRSITPSTGPTDETRRNLWLRYQALQTVEDQKNELIKEILVRYDTLSEAHKTECADRERERDYSRNAQRGLKEQREKLMRLTHLMTRDPFVVVLIDGDGLIFQDRLLQEGEMGGRRAATLLYNAVIDFMQQSIPDAGSSIKVVARLYANLRGLSDTLCKAGIIDRSSTVEEFFRGFTRGKALFDFIDVGYGKDRADDKLADNFKLYLSNIQCHQVIFGCSHDNGYVRLLDEVVMEPEISERITLLEGVPFEKEYKDMTFHRTKFESLFRTSKLNLFATLGAHDPVIRYSATPFTPPGLISQVDANSPIQPVRNGSMSSADTVSGTTWAAALSKAAPPQPLAEMCNETNEVQRNRRGQRIDRFCRAYDKEEVNRIKKIKMCNVHFLRGDCPFGDACSHKHNYKPTPAELSTLRLVARMAPCQNGSDCSEPKCIYGHVCPAPTSKDPAIARGGKSCIFGENCRFGPELHRIDSIPVKMTKVT